MNTPVRRRKKKRVSWAQRMVPVLGLILLCLVAVCIALMNRQSAQGTVQDPTETEETTVPETTVPEVTEPEPTLPVFKTERERAEYIIQTFAQVNNIPVSAYPEELFKLLELHPEAEEFVLNYPMEYGKTYPADMTQYIGTGEVPLLIQWDKRWGYKIYGSNAAGLTACGPTCLSMVALHLLGNPEMSPAYMMDFATQNGYYVYGSGSSWTLFSRGAQKLGLTATELPLVKAWIMDHLKAGEPIVCAMGPGVFTENGHYIVMVGCEDGLIRVNDPNSYVNSQKLWRYEDIEQQIENLWVITKAP